MLHPHAPLAQPPAPLADRPDLAQYLPYVTVLKRGEWFHATVELPQRKAVPVGGFGELDHALYFGCDRAAAMAAQPDGSFD